MEGSGGVLAAFKHVSVLIPKEMICAIKLTEDQMIKLKTLMIELTPPVVSLLVTRVI